MTYEPNSNDDKIYELEFKESALKEFEKLNKDIAEQFLKKLEKVLLNPHIPKNKLSGTHAKHWYKIKLKSVGYRLVYEVVDDRLVVLVITVGRRDKVYDRL
ncbi:type II toxin-antitoxin system RelE family toxin [Moraxella oblonga]|uniref:type II toxin-antitoxin system RelE family toxin n=1 Tax=Moraxella oblonga TaxID=200413 RepID=UPI000AF34166|nr:type II toxin-antitoxin system RelE/ParE family toxin [Moraxella oblonga]